MPTYSTEDPASRYDNPVSRSDEEDFTHSALPPSSRPASSASKGRTYDGETESDFDSEEEDAKLERELFDVEAQLPEQQQAGRKGGKEWVMHAVGKGGSRRSSNRAQQSYSAIDGEGARRSGSTRSSGGSSRRSSTRRMNALGASTGATAAGGSEKGLRRLSLQSGGGGAPVPSSKPTRGKPWAWIICGVVFALLVVAGIVAGVLVAKNKENSVVDANSTSTADHDKMSLSATGTDAQGNTLYATLSGSAAAGHSSSAQDGQYASSLNSAGMYPGKASEYDDGKYHSGSTNGVASPAETGAGRPSSPSGDDGLYHPATATNTDAHGSPTDASPHPSATASGASSGSQGNKSASASASASSTETDDSWFNFGMDDDEESTSASASASQSSGASMGPASASSDFNGGHGLGGPASSPSPSTAGGAGSTQAAGQWGASPTPTSTPAPAWGAPSAPPSLEHGAPQEMSLMTWGTQVITVNAGGASAMTEGGSQAPAWQTGAPTTTSQDWSATPTSVAGQGWGAPPATASILPAIASGQYSTTNFSMAVQPESWQDKQGQATWFTADRHFSPCGIAGNDSDYLVALPLGMYTGSLKDGSQVESTLCGTKVTVTNLADGATVIATVSDACAYCSGDSSLDLSLAAFSALSPTAAASGAGTLDVIWGFNADAEDAEQPFEERGATTVLTSWVGEATGAGGW